ncbi:MULTISPECIES: sensor histidine kinase KdpD [unclassified Prevotella]|uniref:sensor histidine kinase n=1 Tax=unclassified Prevotella TaxID=2638335 RepID=UPI0009DF6B4A|nr:MULTISPECIES: sensor histidine kinase [unclassified Prevotella]
MIWVVIILLLALLAICVVLQMKIKHIREQEAESSQLLNDYQKRVNEMEKLLKDYRSLEQNFDNVGQGYEEALMAFDKMEEEKQKVLKVKETIEKQASEVMAAKQKLEETMLKKKDMIEKYAEGLKQKLDYTHPNAGTIALMANQILNVNDIDMEQALNSEDNVMAQDIAALAIQESGISSFQKAEFKCQMVEEAQATMVFTSSKHAVRALVCLLDNAMKFTTQGQIILLINIEGSNLEFCVEDTGTGVLSEYAEKIFEPYVKLNDFFEGNGIGLTVARSIARRLGGDIKLDTEYHGGARFVFSLPI